MKKVNRMKRTWIQDIAESGAKKLISDITMQNYGKMPLSSKYVTGKPKSKKPNQIGIYFEDPTAK